MDSSPQFRLRARLKRRALVIALALALSSHGTMAESDPQTANATRHVGTFALNELDQQSPSTTRALDAEHVLQLEVHFDDRPSGLIVPFHNRSGRLSTTPDELRSLGLVIPADVGTDAHGRVLLDAIPWLRYRYMAGEQRVVLHVPPSLRVTQRLGYQTPAPVQARRSHGVLLNYDVYARNFAGDNSLSAATTLRWFGRAGALQTTGISRFGQDARAYERLETFWSYSDPKHLWTWTAGDLISGGLNWTRPVRMGGVQWRRNFSTRPDLITIPVPRFTGSAAVPSSIELLVNNVQQFGSEINDGPFVLDSFPRITGAGEATLVVRDALGRSTLTTTPIYVDSQRLARGLTDFSVEAGVLRLGFGDGRNHYDDDVVVSGSWRRGLTDTFTLEAHGELAPDLHVAGLGMVWSPWNRWGVLSASLMRSDSEGLRGTQHTLGYQWNSARFGFDLQTQRASANFRDLARLSFSTISNGTAVSSGWLREQDRASLWMALPRGNLAFTWLRFEQQDGLQDQIRNLSWSQVVGDRVSLSASVFDSALTGTGAALGLSVPLGNNRDVGLTSSYSDGRTDTVASLRQNADYEGGWGWQVQASDSLSGSGLASANFRGRYGEFGFGVDHALGQTGAFLQGSGSVVWMHDWFASRHISDSFAVVSTQGISDVPILSENRLYGKTNSRGYLLLPELRGWQRNRIGIDPDTLGSNYRLGELEQMATPADHSGTLVEFDITKVNPAVVVLLGPSGAPVAAGNRASSSDNGKPVTILVGFDGEAYVENTTTDSVIVLDVEGTRCRYRLPNITTSDQAASKQAGPARIGPLPCERSAP